MRAAIVRAARSCDVQDCAARRQSVVDSVSHTVPLAHSSSRTQFLSHRRAQRSNLRRRRAHTCCTSHTRLTVAHNKHKAQHAQAPVTRPTRRSLCLLRFVLSCAELSLTFSLPCSSTSTPLELHFRANNRDALAAGKWAKGRRGRESSSVQISLKDRYLYTSSHIFYTSLSHFFASTDKRGECGGRKEREIVCSCWRAGCILPV